jgi:hypothetical protein
MLYQGALTEQLQSLSPQELVMATVALTQWEKPVSARKLA